jgi:hypothetical protein
VTSGAGRATPVLPKLEAPLGPQIAELVIGRLSHILLAAWCPALSLRFAPGDGSVGRLFFDLIARHGRSIPSVASPFFKGDFVAVRAPHPDIRENGARLHVLPGKLPGQTQHPPGRICPITMKSLGFHFGV